MRHLVCCRFWRGVTSETTYSISYCSDKLSIIHTSLGTTRHQIFANPELPSKRKRRAMPFGAGYTEYQPEIIFLDLCRGKNILFSEPIVRLQNTKVLLNLYRQPYICDIICYICLVFFFKEKKWSGQKAAHICFTIRLTLKFVCNPLHGGSVSSAKFHRGTRGLPRPLKGLITNMHIYIIYMHVYMYIPEVSELLVSAQFSNLALYGY